MRHKLFIFLSLIALAVVLVALNAASYVSKPIEPDREVQANRSTYNAGATGTRAFFELLAETGRRPVRWQEKPSALSGEGKNKPQTFVIIGRTPREITETETEQILTWAASGGRLVIIDREPPKDLLATTANWRVEASPVEELPIDVDPANSAQMAEKVIAAKPAQPTVFTRGVGAVMPSRFASAVKLEFVGANDEVQIRTIETQNDADEPPPARIPNNVGSGIGSGSRDPRLPPAEEPPPVEDAAEVRQTPFVHVANDKKNILVDFPYGDGQIVYLSDPYIVSNGGIGLVDNAQLAINIVGASGGTIAFDEYHHGYGAGESRLFAYFAETPLPAIAAQFLLLVGFILLSQSRRFARALPSAEPRRLAKLEYVSAMAQLQQRARAFDLAIENIYSEFRRRAARSLGADNTATPRRELASLIAERAKSDAGEIENLMSRAEDISHGAPVGKREVLEITRKLREIEEKLGLKRNRNARR